MEGIAQEAKGTGKASGYADVSTDAWGAEA